MNLVRYLSQFAYFRNHRTSGRRAYFRLAGQLSQVCAESVHIFAYYPRMYTALRPLTGAANTRMKGACRRSRRSRKDFD